MYLTTHALQKINNRIQGLLKENKDILKALFNAILNIEKYPLQRNNHIISYGSYKDATVTVVAKKEREKIIIKTVYPYGVDDKEIEKSLS